MKSTKCFLLMAIMLLCSVTRVVGGVTLTGGDGLLSTISLNDAGTRQYEYTSPVLTLEEASNVIYFTFLLGTSNNGVAGLDESGYPFVAFAEFYLYDGDGNEIALDASNFSTNAQEASEGYIENICDDDRSTFWHSTWSDGANDYHYLQITLPEGQEVSDFRFGYFTRYTVQCLPSVIHVDSKPIKASEPLCANGTCGDNLTWSLADGELVIEGTGDMNANFSLMGLGGVETVTIKEGVTSIAEGAFKNCGNLSSVTIPESVASIGGDAFYGTAWYNNLPDGVIYVGSVIYKYKGEMPANTSIEVKEGTKSITAMAFKDCSGLTSIAIPESVVEIGENAFSGCYFGQDCFVNNSACVSSSNWGAKFLTSEYNGLIVENNVVVDCHPDLTSVNIPEGITGIGSKAFYNCYDLTLITVPESVVEIGEDAFYGNAREIILSSNTPPTLLSSNIAPENTVFFVPVSAYDAYVAAPYWADLASQIKAVDVLEQNLTLTAADDESALQAAVGEENLKFVKELTISGTINSYDFKVLRESMPSLQSLDLSEASIVYNAYEFYWNYHTEDNQFPAYGLYGCKLQSLSLPKSITSIGNYAFEDCNNLSSITIPEGVTSIGNYAFRNCSGLTSIVVEDGNPNYDSRENCNAIIETAENRLVVGCASTVIPNTVTSIGSDAFFDCSGLTSITIPESVASIESYAFYGCSGLTSITIPESVASIESYAFYGCSGLASITIPEGVTSIGNNAFRNCSSLTSIVVEDGNPNYDSRENCNAIIETAENRLVVGCASTVIPNTVTSIGSDAFYDCSGLTSITIPESVVSIESYAFGFCSNLASIVFSGNVADIGQSAFSGTAWYNNLPDGVVYINDVLYDYKGTMPENTVIEVREGTVSIVGNAFSRCSNLSSITIPESVTSIGHYAFQDCTGELVVNCDIPSSSWSDYGTFQGSKFTKVTIGDNVSLVGDYAFYDCSELTTVTLSEGVTAIGTQAFAGCGKLDSIAIAANVATIGTQAFQGCGSLVAISCCATTPPQATAAFAGVDKSLCTLYVPGDAASLYRKALEWRNFGNLKSADGEAMMYDVAYIIDGDTVSVERVAEGTRFVPAIPEKEGHSFGGWRKPSFSPVDIAANADAMLYTNAPCTETMYGDQFVGWDVLFDGLSTTFFHSEYAANVESADGLDHYLRVDFGEGNGLEYFTFTYTIRGDQSPNSTPTVIVVEGSNEAEGMYEEIAVLTGLPTGIAETYTSEMLGNGNAYRYIRYRVTETWLNDKVCGHPFFYIAEFGMTGDTVNKLQPELMDTVVMPGDNMMLMGEFSVNKYLVSFVADGVTLASDSLEYGAPILLPEAPEKEGYTFGGWGEVAETVPAADVTYEGVYLINDYLLAYIVDGDTVRTDSVTYGTAVPLLEEPVKEGYTFSGWSEIPETMPASDVTVSGAFTVNRYLLTYAVDGSTVQSDSIAYGTAITLLDEPVKEGYTFSGWSEAPMTMPAGDVVINGSFVINKYLVSFVIDGVEMEADSLKYGAPVIAPDVPELVGYTFGGWDGLVETVPAHDVTVNGRFIVNKYLVTFMDGDEVIASDSLEYGEAIILPEAPDKEGYTFNGWGEVAKTVPAADVTYYTSYTVNVYRLFYFVNGKLVHSVKLAYGEEIPEYIYEPTEEGEEFLGWVGETYATMPAHDVTYTANITNGIDAMSTDNSQQTTVIYDLSGRRIVVDDLRELQKGIYIINGKKTIVD